MQPPYGLPRIPGADHSAIHGAAADRPKKEVCYWTSAAPARRACRRTVEAIRTGLIVRLVDIPLHRTPFHPEGERMVPANLVHHVVEDPCRSHRDIRVRRAVAVGDLIEPIGERKGRQGIRSGRAVHSYLRERVRPLQESQVFGAITLIAIQISKRRMVCHGR